MNFDNTCFLKVDFSSIGNSRKVSNSQVEADCDKSLLKVSKMLLDSPELEAIKSHDGEVRRYLYSVCLPFEAGIHLLPLGLLEETERKLTEYRARRAELVQTFVDAYPQLCHQAAERLRSLYDPRNYPDQHEVSRSFGMSWQYITFAAPDALKTIRGDVYERERQKINEKMSDAYDEARAVLRETCLELVRHLRERLSPTDDGKRMRLHESTLTNLSAFLDSFNLRNITDDAELSQVVTQARELLDSTDIGRLREGSDYHRAAIRTELEAIENHIDRNLVPVARRRIQTEEVAA